MTEFREVRPTRLVLIRNAADLQPEPAVLKDHDDLGLSDDGRRQCELLARRLRATGELGDVSRIVASNARRARETAERISAAVGDPPIATDCGWCEPHSGECAGMDVPTWLETLGRERVANWTPYAPKSPGGESVREAIERAARTIIETIMAEEGGTVIAVTHTVPLRASLWTFLGIPFHGLYSHPEFTYTGITEWIADGWLPGTGQLRARLVRYNDHAHVLPGLLERGDVRGAFGTAEPA